MTFLDSEIVLLSSMFWHEIPEKDKKFPRDLMPVLWRLMITPVFLPDLDIEAVNTWLKGKGLVAPERIRGQNRTLLGCLVAARGKGYIFVDSRTSAEEKRFTIAHEVSHFLRDYQKPRELAIQNFGASIKQVLDGERLATIEERINASLLSTPINSYVDLLMRGPRNQVLNFETIISEEKADKLALELLAPHKVVLDQADIIPGRMREKELLAKLSPLLRSFFGLPSVIASEYAKKLAYHYRREDSVRDWVKF